MYSYVCNPETILVWSPVTLNTCHVTCHLVYRIPGHLVTWYLVLVLYTGNYVHMETGNVECTRMMDDGWEHLILIWEVWNSVF